MVQLKKTDVNAKIRKFENKTFSTSDLVKQAGYGAKFIEIEKKSIWLVVLLLLPSLIDQQNLCLMKK